MDDEFDENENGQSANSDAATNSDKEEKSISSDLIRGHINTIILRSLSDSDKYGYEIIAEIERKSCGQYSIKQPSLYSALKRLETQGFVTSYWGGTAGGGRRKYFSLTEDGRTITEQNRSEWEYSRTIIDSLISDRDFDFSNPPPSAVNMRVLKDTTTRVPSRDSEEESEDDGRLKELEERYRELLAEKARMQEELDESKAREEYYRNEQFTSTGSELDEEERARYQDIIRGRDEIISNMHARYEEQIEKEKQELSEREREFYEDRLNAERDKFQRDIEEITETMRRQYEAQIKSSDEALSEEERARYEEIIREREEQLASARARYDEDINSSAYLSGEERAHYEELLRIQQEKLQEETARYQQELEEQAALYREREKEIRHQNYMNLINTPPAPEPAPEEFEHYTPPLAEQEEEPTPPPPPPAPTGDYRTVVNKLYANSIRIETPLTQTEFKDDSVRPLDGIDFHDIEEKAAQDGIRIVTSGKKEKIRVEITASVVHKGKALFLSALLLFVVAVIEGAIVMGIRKTYSISIAYPYVLWGLALAVLLVTGLAYANHFGEHSLRKSTPALINTIVIYVLSVILTLIVALSVNIDFHSARAVASFVVIPILYLFGIVIFGITYYLQIKPRK